MKKIIFWGLILISANCSAQSKPEKIEGYKVQIFFLDDTAPIRGYLYEATDSSIVIIPTNDKYQLIGKDSTIEVPITQIKKIKKSIKKAVIIGAIPGFVVGFLLGGAGTAYYGNGNGKFAFGGALLWGTLLGGVTAGITAALTSKTYRINGDVAVYRNKYLLKLRKRSIVIQDLYRLIEYNKSLN